MSEVAAISLCIALMAKRQPFLPCDIKKKPDTKTRKHEGFLVEVEQRPRELWDSVHAILDTNGRVRGNTTRAGIMTGTG